MAFSVSRVVSRGAFFVVRKAQNDTFQASVVVSKKIAKKATERNSIKRTLYALLSQHNKEHPENKGLFMVILQKKPTHTSELRADFIAQFKS